MIKCQIKFIPHLNSQHPGTFITVIEHLNLIHIAIDDFFKLLIKLFLVHVWFVGITVRKVVDAFTKAIHKLIGRNFIFIGVREPLGLTQLQTPLSFPYGYGTRLVRFSGITFEANR